MILIIIISIVFAIGLGFWIFGGYDTEDGGMVTALIAGLLLVICLGTMSGVYYDTMSEIRQYEAVQTSIEVARQNTSISEFEVAALTLKVISWNEWLANIQYWNDSIWDHFIPDEVMNLEPIQ